MKQGCMGICVAVPVDKVARLDRLPARNRTTSVNRAIDLYLNVQASSGGANPYGLDSEYFRGKLELIMRDMNSFRPEEMRQALTNLAGAARDIRGSVNARV
jgi:hypothetical protein